MVGSGGGEGEKSMVILERILCTRIFNNDTISHDKKLTKSEVSCIRNVEYNFQQLTLMHDRESTTMGGVASWN